MKNGILLIAGLVVIALYVIFSMQIYELLYYESEFSQAMYEENMYLVVALINSGIALAAAAIYYYAINSVSFARWYHWLIFLGIAVIFAFALDFIMTIVLIFSVFRSQQRLRLQRAKALA